jgi:hypothetical protein
MIDHAVIADEETGHWPTDNGLGPKAARLHDRRNSDFIASFASTSDFGAESVNA